MASINVKAVATRANATTVQGFVPIWVELAAPLARDARLAAVGRLASQNTTGGENAFFAEATAADVHVVWVHSHAGFGCDDWDANCAIMAEGGCDNVSSMSLKSTCAASCKMCGSPPPSVARDTAAGTNPAPAYIRMTITWGSQTESDCKWQCNCNPTQDGCRSDGKCAQYEWTGATKLCQLYTKADAQQSTCNTNLFRYAGAGKVRDMYKLALGIEITGMERDECEASCSSLPQCSAYAYTHCALGKHCVMAKASSQHALDLDHPNYQFFDKVRSCGEGAPAPPAPRRVPPPDIFMFVADDLSSGELGVGFTGNTHVSTPHIDAFARDSIEFSRAYTPIAICAPSRSVLYTGLNPMRNGAYAQHGSVKKGTTTLPMYMKKLGYLVACGGKTHIKPLTKFPFDFYEQDSTEYQGTLQEYLAQKRTLVAKMAAAAKVEDAPPLPPMFIVHNSKEPHGPHKPDGNHTWMTELKGDSLLELSPKQNIAYGSVYHLLGYFNDIQKLDREFGTFLDTLGRNFGHSERSVTIFLSDHGSDSEFGKWSCYEAGMHVPFYLHHKGLNFLPTSRVSQLVTLADVVPTFIELGGGEVPHDQMDGQSLLPLLQEGAHAWHKKYIFGIHTSRGVRCVLNPYPIRSVSDGRWKYIRNYNAHKYSYQGRFNLDNDINRARSLSYVHRSKENDADAYWIRFLRCRPEEEWYVAAWCCVSY